MPVYVFVSGAIVASTILRVKEDIIVRARVVANNAVIIALRLVVVSVSVAIIIIVIMRRLIRVCVYVSLFPLAKRVFASFAL
jgi:CHASE3 domain sensor protein